MGEPSALWHGLLRSGSGRFTFEPMPNTEISPKPIPFRSQCHLTAEVVDKDEQFAVLKFDGSGSEWAAKLDELPTDIGVGKRFKVHVTPED